MRCSIVASALLVAFVNCSHGDRPSNAAAAGTAGNATNAEVQLATRPASDCDWIPAAEVEAIVGKLAEPPHEGEDGCVYKLPMPQKVLDERAKYKKLSEALSKLPGAEKSDKGPPDDPYGFVLEVDLKDFGIGESVAKSVRRMLSTGDPNDTISVADSATIAPDSLRKMLNGWDRRTMHGGRIGHIKITISKLSLDLDLPDDQLDSVTVHVRDRIPDLPFPMKGYSEKESRDPCILTRQEAESVLGPLLIPPYRIGGDGPFAFAEGPSCGYYTKGHHVLILTPKWERGKFEVASNNGIGGLVRAVSGDQEGQAADTLEGPWDQAAMSLDGRLLVLKGDRSLEVGYRGSGTDEAGALKLARIALPRLAGAKP
jgi:hypothetical protein